MQYTLLTLVQTILSSMDSEAVNSIGDTVESSQVAICARTAYFDLIHRLQLPGEEDFFQLQNSGDINLPTVMYLPAHIEKMVWMRYDSRLTVSDTLSYQTVKYMPLYDFMETSSLLPATGLNWAGGTITNVDGNAIPFYWRTDKKPDYYTSFDNDTVLLDSYVSDMESTLQGVNSLSWGVRQVQWTHTDTFIPQLEENLFPMLLNEAKALAWIELRQTPHEKAEKKSRQHLIASQFKKFRIGDSNSDLYTKLPNYGRRSGGNQRSKRFFEGA